MKKSEKKKRNREGEERPAKQHGIKEKEEGIERREGDKGK
jgi:hypothetical protein